MKKALQGPKMAFLFLQNGQIHTEEVCPEEVVAAVNRGIAGEWSDNDYRTVVLRKLHEWICRYIEEGATDMFCDELNQHLSHVQYANYLVPADFYSPDGEKPQSVYVADMNIRYSVETIAAKEVSRFVTYGVLDRIRKCQHPGCGKIFIGRPQAKWCSKTCGSKFRVTQKRKRDAS